MSLMEQTIREERRAKWLARFIDAKGVMHTTVDAVQDQRRTNCSPGIDFTRRLNKCTLGWHKFNTEALAIAHAVVLRLELRASASTLALKRISLWRCATCGAFHYCFMHEVTDNQTGRSISSPIALPKRALPRRIEANRTVDDGKVSNLLPPRSGCESSRSRTQTTNSTNSGLNATLRPPPRRSAIPTQKDLKL